MYMTTSPTIKRIITNGYKRKDDDLSDEQLLRKECPGFVEALADDPLDLEYIEMNVRRTVTRQARSIDKQYANDVGAHRRRGGAVNATGRANRARRETKVSHRSLNVSADWLSSVSLFQIAVPAAKPRSGTQAQAASSLAHQALSRDLAARAFEREGSASSDDSLPLAQTVAAGPSRSPSPYKSRSLSRHASPATAEQLGTVSFSPSPALGEQADLVGPLVDSGAHHPQETIEPVSTVKDETPEAIKVEDDEEEDHTLFVERFLGDLGMSADIVTVFKEAGLATKDDLGRFKKLKEANRDSFVERVMAKSEMTLLHKYNFMDAVENLED